MLSWGLFWERFWEFWKILGEAIGGLGLPAIFFTILTVIVPAAVLAVLTFLLFMVRDILRDDWFGYNGVKEKVQIGLTYLGQLILVLLYLSLTYGIFGTEKSVEYAVDWAILLHIGLCVAFYEMSDHYDPRKRR